MLFNSYEFLFLLLPLVLVGYFGANRLGKPWLAQGLVIAASLYFYAYNNPVYLLLIAGSIFGNYFLIRLLYGSREKSRKKHLLIIGVSLNLLVLFWFKYYDFFLENLNAALKTDFVLLHIALPLGISFFTFQQIGMLADIYREEIPVCPSLLEYALFVSYFPQLVAGPIVEYNEMAPQFANPENRKFQWENFYRGLLQLSIGMGKKLLIADFCAGLVDFGYSWQGEMHFSMAILTILAYTFQIYFDFSGYCDMACGIGRMMNIELAENFNSPYKACSVTEFWKRWHITLTRFLTKNVYIPLGGNRKGLARTCVNVLVVFLLSGLWHGAAWNFVFWGGLHGLAMVAERLLKTTGKRLPRPIGWVWTFSFVNLAWVFFRAPTFEKAISLIHSAFRIDFAIDPFLTAGATVFKNLGLFLSWWVQHNLEWSFLLGCGEILFTWMLMLGLLLLCLAFRNAREIARSSRAARPAWAVWGAAVLTFSLLMLVRVSPYLYFNF